MEQTKLSDLGALLAQTMQTIDQYDSAIGGNAKESTVHVPNVGNALLFAYEQLRKASENIEDHLLFQSTIMRFYRRNLSLSTHKVPSELGKELIIELTQAEYLKNDTVPVSTITKLDNLIAGQYESYFEMLKPDTRLKHEAAQKWMLELLTVKSEQLFNNPLRILSFAAFAHSHFTPLIDVEKYLVDGEIIDKADYPIVLYIAIQKALLKSNDANVRNALFDIYGVSERDIPGLIAFNIKYDTLASLRTTASISRVVNRNGAAMRVVRPCFFSPRSTAEIPDLKDKETTLRRVAVQVDREYQQVRRSVRTGIIKSIIFLLITKALIGIFVEIPYDIFVTGGIVLLPLTVNLIFPPLFIAITALTFKMPSDVNKKAIIDYVTTLIYDIPGAKPSLLYPQTVRKSSVFNILYIVVFFGAFILVSRCLEALHFNLMQGVIFFIFLSTASFLGYRLTLQIRELEIVPTNQGFLSLLRDTLYAPFILTGRRISYRFSRMNIIAQILDIVIELPLTTVLRLLRQWTAFLHSKQDELL